MSARKMSPPPPPPPFPSALPMYVLSSSSPDDVDFARSTPAPSPASFSTILLCQFCSNSRSSVHASVRPLLSLASVVSSVGRSVVLSVDSLPPPTESDGSYTRTMNVDSCDDGGSLDRRRRNIDRRRPLVSWSSKSPFFRRPFLSVFRACFSRNAPSCREPSWRLKLPLWPPASCGPRTGKRRKREGRRRRADERRPPPPL